MVYALFTLAAWQPENMLLCSCQRHLFSRLPFSQEKVLCFGEVEDVVLAPDQARALLCVCNALCVRAFITNVDVWMWASDWVDPDSEMYWFNGDFIE